MQDMQSKAVEQLAPVAVRIPERGWLLWAVRQTVICIVLLVAIIGGWAWITYKSIDFDQDAKAAVFAPVDDASPTSKN